MVKPLFCVSFVRMQTVLKHHTKSEVLRGLKGRYNHVIFRKRHRLVAKEDHSFENGYDKSKLSYKKELPNKRVVAKV